MEKKKPFFHKTQVQPKLTIGRPGDKYEQEADRMADYIVSRPNNKSSPPWQGGAGGGSMVQMMVQMKNEKRDYPEGFVDDEDQMYQSPIQLKSKGQNGALASNGLQSKLNNSKGGGRSLSGATLQEMGSSFGADFQGVRIHTDARAIQMNQELGAQAFTHGKDVYFNSGKYQPESTEGKRLLVHELTHVVQQGGDTIRRQGGATKKTPRKKKPLKFMYVVVGDKKLMIPGAIYFKNMESLKKKLKTTKNAHSWKLVVMIHGSEKYFGLSVSAIAGGKDAYDKNQISTLFGDSAFKTWKSKYGPDSVSLASCQVGIPLEKAFLKGVLKNPNSQKPAGLGKGCLLNITPIEYLWNNKHIKTRKQFNRLSKPAKQDMLQFLKKLNNTYGYAGQKVPETDLLTYYFDYASKGLWIQREVLITKTGQKIPYLKRTQNRVFMMHCSQGLGLGGRRSRTPVAPPVRNP